MAVLSCSCRKILLNAMLTGINSRRFAKLLIRRPLAVFNADEFKEFHKKKSNKTRAIDFTHSKPLILPNDSHITFVKLEDGDERFGSYVHHVQRDKSKDMKNPKFILEGCRLISEAINANISINQIYFTKTELLNSLPLTKLDKKKTSLYKVTEKSMKVWSDTEHSAGLMAVATRPKDVGANYRPSVRLNVVIDGVEDEGHVGTLIRSAAAAGVGKVFTTGTFDPWTPKVLRAAMGGHFYIPLLAASGEMLTAYAQDATSVYVVSSGQDNTDSLKQTSANKLIGSWEPGHAKDGESTRYDKVSYKENSLLIISNKQPNKCIQDFSSKRKGITLVQMPRNLALDNIAVCGSIVLYEMKRQFEQLIKS